MKKILVIGRTGQIAQNLNDILGHNKNFEFISTSRKELDLAVPEDVYGKLSALKFSPDIIINAAAYTAVDLAEDERETCDKINHLSVFEIARFCKDTKALLVHYSTDYVFDGSGNEPFIEDNSSNLSPLNHYGTTKLAGERAVINSGCEYLIFRTAWVYNHSGKNFVNTILRLAQERPELKIVSDQTGSPTYAADIASATITALGATEIKSGIYNLVAPEFISWHGFAELIVNAARKHGFDIKTESVIPISSVEYPTRAKRPANSRLSFKKLENDFGITLPSIKDSLNNCLQKIGI